MSLPKNEAWFAAKKYGYGWGFPLRWQGWLVLVVFVGALTLASLRYAAHQRVEFFISVVVLSAAVVAICAWKGEAPKWRWGEKTDEKKKP